MSSDVDLHGVVPAADADACRDPLLYDIVVEDPPEIMRRNPTTAPVANYPS
jgi:hypothetical protein